jgi:RNA polymerase sigma factor (sigma-70 family)
MLPSMELDDLVLAVQAEKPRAWTKLGQRLAAELDPYFRRWVGEAEADDLTQKTLMAVARKLPDFEVRADQPFIRWVRGIAHIQVMEALRQQRRRERRADRFAGLDQGQAPATNLNSHLARAENLELLEQELEKLDSPYRRAIENDLAGGDAGTLAAREHIKRGSARTRRRRAYALLRDLLRKRRKSADEQTPTPP